MPQIAQQDYIQIEVPQGAQVSDVLTEEKAIELNRRGVLLDVVINHDGYISRIVAYQSDSQGNVASISYAYLNTVVLVEY